MREKLPISSDQIELLLAFEKTGSLEELSSSMAKDPSVISRRLKELANQMPVIVKVGGRWQMTALGREINVLHRQYLSQIEKLIPTKPLRGKISIVPDGALLIVINAQKALHFSGQRKRSNLKAEQNIVSLLKLWRRRKWPVMYVKHVSDKASSLFYSEGEGCEFIPELQPAGKELVILKRKASAFMETSLQKEISRLKLPAIVLVGFTAGECIDATARHALDMGISTIVIGDATAAFDLVATTGRLIKAEKIHRSVMLSLQARSIDVIDTASVQS